MSSCIHTFLSSASELDTCMWSLNDVLKRLVKGSHGELLQKLLETFESSLCALCLKFLPEERKEESQCLEELNSSSSSRGPTFCLLLDLLEVLGASVGMCRTEASLKSQSLVYIHSSGLLTAVSGSSEYYVKKKVMLLLKRAVLQRLGEDWACVGGLTTLRSSSSSSGLNMMAHSVLAAVNHGWLNSIQVQSASYFGGTLPVCSDVEQEADSVMLRAVSLTVLRSIELQTHTDRVDGVTAVCGYLQSLWSFLRRCNVQLDITHLCCWIGLVFGEQDDDMIEAARATLSIFLNHWLRSGLKDSALEVATCTCGSNPHCHFVLLLQSISFDHSILLDFLISTETCFLEYFVRYLKYLKRDWQGFCAACKRSNASKVGLSSLSTYSARLKPDISPTVSTNSARLKPDISPTVSTYSARLKPDISPTVSTNSARLKPDISPTVCGYSARLKPDISPTVSSYSARLKPDISPTVSTYSARLKPDISPTVSSYSARLRPDISPTVSTYSARLKPDISPTVSEPPVRSSSSPAVLRLVDYESSEESDSESMDVSEVKAESSSLSEDTNQSSASVTHKQSDPATTVITGSMSTFMDSGQLRCKVLNKSSICLSQLREVVTRLHAKKLFPYNPSSLLKLLAQVESCYQQSP
uniref:Lines homolog 1 n=2 Tax=Gouania willdenowi TaxID=441366 RepID=A0A8C5GPN2_GOUWI